MKCLNETVHCTCTFKSLKDLERYIKIWKTIQGVGGHWLLKTREQLLEFVKFITDHQMALKLMEEKMSYSSWRVGNRKICMKFVPHNLIDEHILPRQWSNFRGIAAWWRPATYLFHLTSHQSTFIYSLKWKLPSKLQDFRMSWSSTST